MYRLNNCPHCGGKASLKTLVTRNKLGKWTRDCMIACENGDERKIFSYSFRVDENPGIVMLDTNLVDAVDEWNRRTGASSGSQTTNSYTLVTSDGYKVVTSDGYCISAKGDEVAGTSKTVATADGYDVYTSDDYLVVTA